MKKKLLIITKNSPYPLTHGGAIAQYYFIEKLVKDYELTLLTMSYSSMQTNNLKLILKKLPELNLIVYEENHEKKDKVVVQKFNLKLIIWKQLKKYYNKFQIPILNRDFVHFIKNHLENHNYNFIQCDFFETLPLLDFLGNYSKIIFVHHELLFKRYENEKDKSKNYIKRVFNYEVGQLKKADNVIVFNMNDHERLSKHLNNIEISPFGIPNEIIFKESASRNFSKLIILGGESHEPNKLGLTYFLENIYIPNVDKLFSLYIVGNWSEEFKLKYQKYEKIIFTGFLDNLNDIFKEGILVAPIFSGSGLRTKILLAISNKVPVITTRFAAEGLFDEVNCDHFAFFESSKDFLDYFNKHDISEYFGQLANNSFSFYSRYFDSNYLYQRRCKVFYL